ncbi:4-diphosphocytidyl-2C-methyl-D-erythritol kinase [Aerococcus urinaehominis]|uniref:4-diphosphocytidyl-2-C-methyl-D-erythritol kinase n=1 Tax=Aerococcus urinaehominis TaxID=128944 RepID=A0A0X8FLL3_9LACT|nr:4-(cytidine 5'-diphospho)-2-C-methyl-D-erythritol kinase [Aerococcus urinaehominis]AMB99545.1 4-diphosphocytidyl-2C-methyl-D-erythritol kinase [Aerococcus urinaehominis]SDM34589.1 4-diphosphocytidyl-2-C-methyl-D-erythritol kinase [Aerococcus urinaehominis]
METYEIAPAKINLAQDILFKRPDGYHEIDMVMASVDLSDYLTFKCRSDQEIRVTTSQAFLPNDKRNHAYQAARLLQVNYQVAKGVDIGIKKRIPVAAGLGGGSTNAAAVLRALNRLWHLHLSQEELVKLASQLGSDVPYSLVGGVARVQGMGEIIKPLSKLPVSWVIIAKPPISVSTRKIFNQVDMQEFLKQPNASQVAAAIEAQDYQALMAATGNSLEQVTFARYPWLAELKAKMEKFGAQGVTMSGSGPSIIGFTQHQQRGQRIFNGLKGFCEEVYLVRVLNRPQDLRP